jgi:hypothetical protein
MRRLNNLVIGLDGYLHFEFGGYRSAGFNERGFTSAIIQLINGRDVKCEEPHPYLESTGKPKAVDYFWNGWGNDHGNYMEFKWFGTSSPSFKSMLQDIYRLGAISCRSRARTYFVVAGLATKVAKSLNSPNNKRQVRGKSYTIIRSDSKRHPDIKPSHVKHIFDAVTEVGPSAPLKIKLVDPQISFSLKELEVRKFGVLGFEVIGTLR